MDLGEWKRFAWFEPSERGAKELTVLLPEGHPLAPKKVRRRGAGSDLSGREGGQAAVMCVGGLCNSGPCSQLCGRLAVTCMGGWY